MTFSWDIFSSYRQFFLSPPVQPKESNLQPWLLKSVFGMAHTEKNVEREILNKWTFIKRERISAII